MKKSMIRRGEFAGCLICLLIMLLIQAADTGCALVYPNYTPTSSSTSSSAATSSSTFSDTSTGSASGILFDDFEDADLVNETGENGQAFAWEGSGGQATVGNSTGANHTDPGSRSMLVWMDRSGADMGAVINYYWSSDTGAFTSLHDTVRIWAMAQGAAADFRLYGRDQSWTNWNATDFTASGSWQQRC